MPHEQHSLRKPRHAVAFARLGTVFDANNYDNPLRTPNTLPVELVVESTIDRNESNVTIESMLLLMLQQ